MGRGARLELSNIELNGGVTTGRGAAVRNEGGHVSLEGCLLTNHSATGDGGAIFTRGGSLLVENSTLSGCSSTGGEGGAIFVARSGPLTTGSAAGWQQHQPGSGWSAGLGLVWLTQRAHGFLRGVSNWTRWALSLPPLPPLPLPSPLLGSDYGLGRAVVSLSGVMFVDNFAPVGTDFAMGDSRIDTSGSDSSSWDPGSAFLEDDLVSQWDGGQTHRTGVLRRGGHYEPPTRHGSGWKVLFAFAIATLAASFALSAAWQAFNVQQTRKRGRDHAEDSASKQHGLFSWLNLPQQLSCDSNKNNFLSFTIDKKGAADENLVRNHKTSEVNFNGDATAALSREKRVMKAKNLTLAEELRDVERAALLREGRGKGPPVVALTDLIPVAGAVPSARGAHAAVFEATWQPHSRRHRRYALAALSQGGHFGTKVLNNNSMHDEGDSDGRDAGNRRTIVALKRINLPSDSSYSNSSGSGNNNNRPEGSEALLGWRREVAALSRLPAHHHIVSLLGVVVDGAGSSGNRNRSGNNSSDQIYESGSANRLGSEWFTSSTANNARLWGAGLILEWAPLGCLRDRLGSPPFVVATAQSNDGSATRFGRRNTECRLDDWVDKRSASLRRTLTSADSTTDNSGSDTEKTVTALQPCAAQVAIDVASAIAHCHAHGLAHGDVKAANVLLFPDQSTTNKRGGEVGVRAKLADFGEARWVFNNGEISSHHHHQHRRCCRHEQEHRRSRDPDYVSESNAFTREDGARTKRDEVKCKSINKPRQEEKWRMSSTGSSNTKSSRNIAGGSTGTTTSSASSDDENYNNDVASDSRSRSDSGTSIGTSSNSSNCTGSGSDSSSGSEDGESAGSSYRSHYDSKSISTRGRGTLLYAAPEVVRRGPVHRSRSGKGVEYDPTLAFGADVWALGMVVAELRASMPLLDIWRGNNQHQSSFRAAKSASLSRTSKSRTQIPQSNTKEAPAVTADSNDNHYKKNAPVMPSLLDACGWQPDLVALGLSDAPAVEHDTTHELESRRRHRRHHRRCFATTHGEAPAGGRGGSAAGKHGQVNDLKSLRLVAVSAAEAQLGALLEKCWRPSARDRPPASVVLGELNRHLVDERADSTSSSSSSNISSSARYVLPTISSDSPSTSITHGDAAQEATQRCKPFTLTSTKVVTSQPQPEALAASTFVNIEDPPYMESAALLPAAWDWTPTQYIMARNDIEEGNGGMNISYVGRSGGGGNDERATNGFEGDAANLDLATGVVESHSSAQQAAHISQFHDTWGAWFVPTPASEALQSSENFGGGFGESPRRSRNLELGF